MGFKFFALAFVFTIAAFQVEARPFQCETDGVSTEELQRRQEKMMDSNRHAEGFLRHSLGGRRFTRLQNGEQIRMGGIERAVWNGMQVRESCINDIYAAVAERTPPVTPIEIAQQNQQIPGVSIQQTQTDTASTTKVTTPLVTIEIPEQAANGASTASNATSTASTQIQRQTASAISTAISRANR